MCESLRVLVNLARRTSISCPMPATSAPISWSWALMTTNHKDHSDDYITGFLWRFLIFWSCKVFIHVLGAWKQLWKSLSLQELVKVVEIIITEPLRIQTIVMLLFIIFFFWTILLIIIFIPASAFNLAFLHLWSASLSLPPELWLVPSWLVVLWQIRPQVRGFHDSVLGKLGWRVN